MTSSPDGTSQNTQAATEAEIQRQIDAKIEESIRYYATQPPDAIAKRIQELDNECDVERTLGMSAAGIGLGGIVLSFFGGGRKWLLLGGTALSMLLVYLRRGASPALPLLRKLGVRTRAEIEREKNALKILRGDFQLPPNKLEQLKTNPAQDVLRSVTT
jgi:hypothetical protein